ncbi:hypothetical protein JL720_16547 [Aureococcus anophagefferens]|nr:hypothetical protein JL720_16547 [Aureococcus anophagefferens]
MACTERAWVLASARRVPLLLREGDGEELWDAALFDRCVDAAPTESASRECALADAQRHASAKRSDFTYGEVGSERFAVRRPRGASRCRARRRRSSTSAAARAGPRRRGGAREPGALRAPRRRRALAVARAARRRRPALGDSETFILESDAVADARWAALATPSSGSTGSRGRRRRATTSRVAAKLEPGAVVVACGWALPGDRFALAFTFHADVCWGGTCVLFVHVAGDADRPATAATPRGLRPRAALPARKRGARQRLYECLTCCPDGIIEVCPACAASCHRGHDLRECDGASGGALRGGDDDLAFCSCGFACACHTRCLP